MEYVRIALLGIMFMCGVLMVRNARVFRYRNRIIDRYHKAWKKDIRAGRDGLWRCRVYDSVSYNEMVLKFWKPLDSFYKDKSFLED